MSHDSQTLEDLTALYQSQSPAAFTAVAMSATQKPNDHSKRIDEAEHGGDKPCDYPCCGERGYCSPGCNIILAAGIVVCCICCCYATDGFCGVWTYWPA